MPVAVGAVATVLGIPVGRWLEATTYRKPDEDDVPHPGRRWWVPLVLGVVTAFVVHRIWFVPDDAVPGWPVAAVLTATGLVMTLSCVCLAAMDLDVHRLPDRIMWPTMGFLVAGVSLAALVGGGFEPWLRSLLAAVGSGGFYFLLALLSLARGSLALGLGDVKLAVVLGGVLGWFGWPETLAGIYAGFLVGGLFALALLVGRRVGWKDDFAYGPPMMVGALLGLLLVPQAVGGLL
ncbi:leader peptidase (prepilin peptidase)/N-methyltransferase [Ornithinimicrobium humiphilum]|uniref:Leader peptidase (Prepilin peptidase)/N-methyltransferase n=1 Tax=Ornithinimicrobium humiphilum TaxID=125288 RepID=A0A543KPP1_9MICO|nr:leader peptidase (prepilin peptidase)/N-methyltransferase [Ornithinimicrobium humiphilum]